MTTYYKATFTNGKTLTRSTASRAYSHAYLIKGQRSSGSDPWGSTWGNSGFSGTEQLASKAMTAYEARVRAWSTGTVRTEIAEVAPAIEITANEYRSLKSECWV